MYDVTFTMKSDLGELAQLPVSVYFDNQLKMTVSVRGSEGAVDIKTLQRAFKRYEGITPGQYKESVANQAAE